MRTAAEGHLTTEALMWNQDDRKTISNMVCIVNLLICSIFKKLKLFLDNLKIIKNCSS